MTDKLSEMAKLKHELQLSKNDVSELQQSNKKMELELENRQ